MKRILVAITFFLLATAPSFANHIKGGFFTYQYMGPAEDGGINYRITLTVYMICPTHAPNALLNDPINFSIFDAGTNQFIKDVSVRLTSTYDLQKLKDEPCISGDQRECYYTIVIYDLPIIDLPLSQNGYVISYQRCCRISGIQNVAGNSSNIGNTFTINIPGTEIGQNATANSSPVFLVNDTAVVCNNSYFQYSFQATDIDNDSLSYAFCGAYTGGSVSNAAPTTASNPPYEAIPYQPPFNGAQPLGAAVTIDPRTGLISGTAPPNSGEYVVCVCVSEFRHGILIGITRKELHVKVGDCLPIKTTLNPQYITCDGFTLSFANNTPSPDITTYFWDFGVIPATNDTSNLTSPTFTYPDTGQYVLKIVANRNQQCADSTTSIVKVYPGFFPGFLSNGICVVNPVFFIDTTKTKYGIVDTWGWDFGDATTLADTSHKQNPSWTFADPGNKDVTFIVTNSKGCIDTIHKTISIIDKPPITLNFADTLICRNDAIQLGANGTGVFSWTPLSNITNPNTPNPTVSPPTTTWYYVTLDDNGCHNRDSVRIRVVNSVALQAMKDTTICQGDAAQLHANSDGLSFSWTPAANLNDPTLINPIASPVTTTTTYLVTATIGSCHTTDDVVVTTIPYPVANAGLDPTVCYNKPAQLNAQITGIAFNWTPVSYLNNPFILNPVSSPPRTTQYILSVYDILGCPKPGLDTIIVFVRPKVRANAGRDTSIVVGQPLQFNGSGGATYLWSPPGNLDNPDIANPVGIYNEGIERIRYTLVVEDSAGCADSAFMTVSIFKSTPTVFVPSAFTPNGDGLNDVIRPIAVGIDKINYFSIYNRYGQLVFTTTVNGQGWDGRINGRAQGSGVYVWMVNAVDYLGKTILQKGTVVLIR